MFLFYLLLYLSLSLELRILVFADCRMDFAVETSKRMFSDVVQIQLDTSLYSQYTALQRAHVTIADFWLKLTRGF